MAATSSAVLELLCNSLSVTVILACIILKVPQIIAVFKSQSSKGVSFGSVLLETAGYSIMLTYHFAKEYPLSTYFEYTFLVCQDLILVVLLMNYNGDLKLEIVPWFAVYFVVSSSFAFKFLPEVVLNIAIGLSLPISIGSKLMQIYTIVKNKNPGQVSAATWAIAFYTTFARSITTVVQTGDVTVLTNFALSCFLNLTLLSLVLYYRQAGKKKLY